MPPVTKKNLLTSAAELKFFIVLAIIATIVVCATVVWTIFFSKPIKNSSSITLNQSVSITEKPKGLQQSPKHILRTKNTEVSHSNKAIISSNNKIIIGKGKFYVQVGAFKEVVRARTTYEKMRKTYKRAQIMPKSGFYAIWVGPVRNKREAKILQKQILKHYKIKGFITSEK
ncbi:SPOR domain-containing protein [Ghiorsea bivora]|uniref:SPOR domain-containing protein n=1 Tax=Ghiorsea bivora TaxID=1485545 RepID=UPI0009DE8630|nr:SPOR domain-containing protein [Ghiorsea bivora]